MSGKVGGSRLLVGGAINTDLVATVSRAPGAGETVTGRSFATYSGGKGANQAVAAHRAGASVAMLGAVGDDAFGRDRRDSLDREGIDVSRVSTRYGVASGVALIVVEQDGENRIAYVPGATLSVDAEACQMAIAAVRPTHILTPNELPPDALLALFRAARAFGAHVTLNAAPDPAAVRPLLPFTDVLIVNRGEARTMTGDTSDDPSAMARALLEFGPQAVIVTAGSRGAFGATQKESFAYDPPVVDVIDTTGAGDTFCGAFAAAVIGGAELRSACEFAVTASALSVRARGAQPSIPWRGEILDTLGG